MKTEKILKLDQGAVVKLILNSPPGNILDSEMIQNLSDLIADLRDRREVRLILLEGKGAHFSYGASIQEHTREKVRKFLRGFHACLREFSSIDIPILSRVRGQCLGGGLELALLSDWIIGSEDSRFGLPEIGLGVFPPAATLLLPDRVATRQATDLILTGRTLDAQESLRMGLIDVCIAESGFEPWFVAFLNEHILPKSAFALRLAKSVLVKARTERLTTSLPILEKVYLEDLMAGRDSNEGIQAFLEKRPPRWMNR